MRVPTPSISHICYQIECTFEFFAIMIFEMFYQAKIQVCLVFINNSFYELEVQYVNSEPQILLEVARY